MPTSWGCRGAAAPYPDSARVEGFAGNRLKPSTCETHVRNVYRKLGVHRRQDLIDLVNATIEG